MIGIGYNSQPIFDLNNFQTDMYSYIANIDDCNLSPTYNTLTCLSSKKSSIWSVNNSETESFENQANYFDCIINSNNGVKKDHQKSDEIEVPCKYCNEYNEYHCPNHSHLYSTDEASSSEAEFICSSNAKSGKSKNKKKVKEVKKGQQNLLSSFAKLFTQ